MRIMDSFVNAPQVHAAAVKDPKLLGGPFIDLPPSKAGEVRALRDATRSRRSALVCFSAAIAELGTMLREQAKGHSLEPLYQHVPAILRGYVELGYDLNNAPSFRLIEPLLYRSPYYDDTAQSLMLSLICGDDRPFVLSTPRLDTDDTFHLQQPFSSETVDELFRLKSTPASWGRVGEVLDGSEGSENIVREFFTHEAPRPYKPYSGSGIRWRYFGHACILIETVKHSILLDPVLSYTYESGISRFTYEDLPDRIDYVLITHNHQDHVLFETLLQIRHKTKHIVVPRNSGGALQDPSLALALANTGFHNVIELDELETMQIEDGRIMGLPFLGEHADLAIRTKLAYLVQLGPHSMLFAADSRNVEPAMYEHVHRETGDIDILFLGMECDGAPLTWLYGPLICGPVARGMDTSRRLSGSDFEQAVRIVDQFHFRHVYVYAMGQEPWLNYIMSIKYTDQSKPILESDKLLQYCHGRGICAERLFGEKQVLLD